MSKIIRCILFLVLEGLSINMYSVISNDRIMYDLAFSIDIFDPLVIFIGLLICLILTGASLIIE